MKTKQEILEPFIEIPFRHTRIVDEDNALIAMQEYADQFNPKYMPEPGNIKILINTDIGLFNLSYLASKHFLELSGIDCFFYRKGEFAYSLISFYDIDENDKGDYLDIYISKKYQGHRIIIEGFNFDYIFFPGDLDSERYNEYLIKTFEELGDKCNTDDCKLKIIEIPVNIEYYIEQPESYGEVVHEYHRQWS